MMKFAEYYDATKFVEKMQESGKLDNYPDKNNAFEGVYVCMDANDFWIDRIIRGYNEKYEKEDGKYLVERNKIDICDVMNKLYELHSKRLPEFKEKDFPYERKNKIHDYFDKFAPRSIVEAVMLLDNNGLNNYDCYDVDSFEDAIKGIDEGYKILRLVD